MAETKSAPSTPDPLTLTDAGAWFDIFGAGLNESGQAVTPITAMSVPAVRACVMALSQGVGQLPVELFERGQDSARSVASKHPIYELIRNAASDHMSAGMLREEITRDALLYDVGGIALISRNSAGKPLELTRLHPEFVTVELDGNNYSPVYRMNYPGDSRVLAPADVLHIRPLASGAASLQFMGEAPIKAIANTIGLALAMERHAAKLFANGARPSGLLTTTKAIKGEGVVAKLAAGFRSWMNNNNGGTLILEEGMDFKPLTFSSVDAQFAELRKFTVEEIARAFRIPPTMVGELAKSTLNNTEALGLQFLTFTLLPWLKQWESEIILKLLTPEERAQYYPEFIVDDLLRVDFAQRAEGYSKMIAARVINPNEARARENLPPYAGGEKFLNPAIDKITETAAVG